MLRSHESDMLILPQENDNRAENVSWGIANIYIWFIRLHNDVIWLRGADKEHWTGSGKSCGVIKWNWNTEAGDSLEKSGKV